MEKKFESTRYNLVKSTGFVLFGSVIINILNYIFTILIGRLLGPAAYGEVAVILGLSTILTVPALSLTTFMATYSAKYKAEKKISSLNHLRTRTVSYVFVTGLGVLILFWLSLPWLSAFLKIGKSSLFIYAIVFPISLVSSVNTGTLQGLKAFIPFSITGIITTFFKLVLSLLLVNLGFWINSVMFAIVLGGFLSYLFGHYQVRSILFLLSRGLRGRPVHKKDFLKEIISFAPHIFLSTLFITLFSNIDLILAKHYLSPTLAGFYSALSVTGKIISYISGALISVMLPFVSSSHTKKDGKSEKILYFSLSIILIVSGGTLAFFTLYPKLVISLLFGANYLAVSPYLYLFGLAMLFMTLSSVFANFFIGIGGKKFIYPLLFGVIMEVVLIYFYHENILDITLSVVKAAFVMLTGLIVIFLISKRKAKI